MREILFRGKRVDNGEWVEGCLYYFHRESNPKNKVRCFILLPDDLIDNENEFEVIPKTVGQWTGRCDKDETKLFGGDKCWDGDYQQEFTVEWDNEKLAWMAVSDSCGTEFLFDIWNENCVIIGNVHDNQELLKGDAE